MRRFVFALLLSIVPVAAPAQDTTERDRGILQAFLEDNLSDAGRSVRIEGFAGALSSRATFDVLTIADGEGVWITIRNGALSWNRQALFSGRIDVDELSAAEVEMPRLPQTSGDSWAEARGFALPELPVSVNIGALKIDRVILGAPVLGEPVTLAVSGSMQLAGGEGSASLLTSRVDGPTGRIDVRAAYSNATRQATLDLLAEEGPEGIAVRMLGIPGLPSATLAVSGSGSFDDLALDVALSTDGVRRLAGTLALARDQTGDRTQRFSANISGDLAPVLLPEYREFFGDRITLTAEGSRSASGRTELSSFNLTADAVRMSGAVTLAGDGLPERADIDLDLGLPDKSELLLPLPGVKTYLRGGVLAITYGLSTGSGWSLDGRLSGLRRGDTTLASLRLDGSGRITRAGQSGMARNSIGGTITYAAGGIDLADPKVEAAVGSFVSGKTILNWQEGRALRLSRLTATGQGYALEADLAVGSVAEGVPVSGRATATLRDASRLSALAGRPLGGAAEVSLSGTLAVLSGQADVEVTAVARDLTVDQAEADRLLRGEARISASVKRDETGTTLRRFEVTASTLTATATGIVSSDATDLTGTLVLSDLSVLRPGTRGRLRATLDAEGPLDALRLNLEGDGSDLAIGQPQADAILRGASSVALTATLADGKFLLGNLDISNPQLRLAVKSDGDTLDFDGRLADMGLIAPGFPGPLTVTGTVVPSATASEVNLTAAGPGQTQAQIRGRIASGNSDLTIAGSAQSALLNPLIAPRNIEGPVRFDLTLLGAPRPSSLAGTVTLTGGRLAAPTLGVSLEGISADAVLSGGRASVTARASVRGGGVVRVSGPVALDAPQNADLAIEVRNAVLREADLYRTSVTGNLTYSGPIIGGGLLSGAVDLGDTEVRIASTGFGTNPITGNLRHVNDRQAVRVTRARAGVQSSDAVRAGPARPLSLDVTVNAPSRIFVRGRGLDAELGGSLVIRGTSADVQPTGQFDLVRGRLDLLGKRFVIDEGLVRLEGALVPYVRFLASTSVDGTTATITIEGQATEPRITFSSSPQLPDEEIVARLLFGRGLDTLSVFQAAQLASAVATLTGRGGEGIVSRIRSGLGLDDFDIQADEDGNIGVRAGKYISRNVYTDVTVNNEGESEVRLNLDVTPDITLRGRADTSGETGIGIYFERDY